MIRHDVITAEAKTRHHSSASHIPPNIARENEPSDPLSLDNASLNPVRNSPIPSQISSSSFARPLRADLYDPGFCKPCHAFIDMPTFRAISYNVRTLSGMATTSEDLERQSQIFRNIRHVSLNADIILLQETKCPPETLYDEFRAEWEVFDNPTLENKKVVHRAGTVILVRRSFAHNFTITDDILDPGYLQVIKFTPRTHVSQGRPFFSKTFSVTNAYIHSTCTKTKLGQLKLFGDYKDGCHHSFAGGDWNVKLLATDSANGKRSSGKVRKEFVDAFKRRRMTEVWHPAKTKISNHDPPQVSRLDRWFTTHTPGERQVMEPKIWMPSHPHEPGLGARSPSDHFPVHLSFHPTKRHSNWRTIPVWLAKHSSFAKAVAEEWAETGCGKNPCDELWMFNSTLQRVARKLLDARRLRTEDRTSAISMAAATYSKLISHKLTAEEAYDRMRLNVILSMEISPGKDRMDLIDSLKNYLWSGSESPARPTPYAETRSAFSSAVRSYAPKQPKTKVDFNQNVKKAHCDSRTGLSFLVNDQGDRITNSKDMAAMLKKAWEPVWRGSAAPRRDILSYLRPYRKRVRGIDLNVSIADVINEVLVKRNSCAGPNGIPFACYTELCDLAAPILHRVCLYLMEGGSPKHGFNCSNLFFLPKDGSGLPTHNRPIAASNTDNRIIANIIRRKLESSCHAILDARQAGFVRGKSIEENVCFYNRKFYEALYSRYRTDLPGPGQGYDGGLRNRPSGDSGYDYNVLFLDFAKAFDSVSRDFLFMLLEWIGIPHQYVTIIRALYHDVFSYPALHGKTKCIIRMRDGLKQGCPLSPLLFILAIDPLISLLGRLPRVDPLAFADDVALGGLDPVDLVPGLLLIDHWSKVSRVVTNVGKTKLISTSSAPVMFTHLAPPHWRTLNYVDSYVYLGVLIGRSVDVTMVYEEAVEKMERRVCTFMPMQSRLDMAGRVRLANVYLLTIFSYLFRFFLMSEGTSRRVLKSLKRWLIRGTVTNMARLTAPAHLLGLATPLKDLAMLNMAALLRRREAIPNPAMSGDYSMLIGDHVEHAAISYASITGSAFPPLSEQAPLMENLLHSDGTAMGRLAKTFSARMKRHGRDMQVRALLCNVASNALRLPATLKPELRNHLFNIVHQCVFTNYRARNFGKSLACEFCGHYQEDFQHLFIDCVVARETIDAMRCHRSPLFREAAKFLASATLGDFLFETRGLKVTHMRFLLSFSLAVWKTRRFYRVALGAPPLHRAPSRVLLELGPTLRNWLGGGRRDKESEKRSFQAAVSILPSPATFVYTDGSSYGNPGPSGAGFAVSGDNVSFFHMHSRSLGHGTNNMAELCAIDDAIAFLLDREVGDLVYIFTDNRLAMQVALGRVTPVWAAVVSGRVQRNVGRLAEFCEVHLIWVPGHADVAGNELADRLAKLGSAGITGVWQSVAEIPTSPPPDPGSANSSAGPARAPCQMCTKVLRALTAGEPGSGRPKRKRVQQRRTGQHSYNLRSRRHVAPPIPSSPPPGPVIPGSREVGDRKIDSRGVGESASRGKDAHLQAPEEPESECPWGYWTSSDEEDSEDIIADDGRPPPPSLAWALCFLFLFLLLIT